MRQDIERRLVTVEGARRYGVVIADDRSVDADATAALRSELIATRGEPILFNRGGTIEEVKARCEEETNLPPPESPQFTGSSAA